MRASCAASRRPASRLNFPRAEASAAAPRSTDFPTRNAYDATYNGNGYAIAVVDSGVGGHVDVPFLLQVDFTANSPYNYAYDPSVALGIR